MLLLMKKKLFNLALRRGDGRHDDADDGVSPSLENKFENHTMAAFFRNDASCSVVIFL